MKCRGFVKLVACALVLMLAPLTVAAQDNTSIQTADGQPDISGIFTFRTLTPLQRPAALEGQDTLSVEEAASFEASRPL